MWQTVVVVAIVALAAYLVGRRFWRGLTGKGPACCGGPDQAGGCTACVQPQRLTLADLTPPPPGEACPHCPPAGPQDQAGPESEEAK